MELRYPILFFLILAVFVVNCAVPSNGTVTVGSINKTTVTSDLPAENLIPVPEQTFKEAEKEIVDFINSLLRQLLPKVVGGSGASSLSPKCTAGMMKIFGNIRRLKGWTIKMLDSMGKPVPGIFKGTSYTMGNYDECLDLSISNKGEETLDESQEMFRGKYCRIKIKFRKAIIETAKAYHGGSKNASDLGKLKDIIQAVPFVSVQLEYLTHYFGLCLPSTCTDSDVNELAQLIPFPGKAELDRCDLKSEERVDTLQLVTICIFLFLTLLAFVSTFWDWFSHSNSREKIPSLSDHDKRCVSVSIAFSFCNNTKHLMKNVSEDVDSLLAGKALRGIVVASVVWIIVGNTYLFPFEAFFIQAVNLENLRNYWDEAYFSIIQGFPLAIDALLVCYGFILTYSHWYDSSKTQKIKVNVIGLLIKDAIGFCVPLAFCVGIIFLLPLLGSGPFWGDLTENTLDKCKKSVGTYFEMYGNLLDLEDQCFPHLWIVPCFTQITAVGIILTWILSKKFKSGIFLTLLSWIGCTVTVAIYTYNNNLPPSYVPYFSNQANNLFWRINMSVPFIHFGPFAVGMLTGILIANKEQHRSRMWVGAIGWAVCIVLLYGIFSILYTSRNEYIGALWSSVYASLHKTIFAFCVAWVMMADSFGVGGAVTGILSWRLFDPLCKLSYYALLFHVLVITYVVGTSRTHFEYSHLELISKITFYIAASYVLAYFFIMLLEMPLKFFKAILFPRKTQRIDVTPLNNFKLATGDIVSKSTIEGNCKLWSITETKYEELKVH